MAMGQLRLEVPDERVRRTALRVLRTRVTSIKVRIVAP
jgi:hypothetical protein